MSGLGEGAARRRREDACVSGCVELRFQWAPDGIVAKIVCGGVGSVVCVDNDVLCFQKFVDAPDALARTCAQQ